MSTAWRAWPIDLLELFHRSVEAHLGLLLVGDDVGRLLAEPAVLLLRLHDRLLELHLRVGALAERAGELRLMYFHQRLRTLNMEVMLDGGRGRGHRSPLSDAGRLVEPEP